jgi:2-polyprenyl-3-methyl-5-hydroxy-6-metoxy-1,4-benzoquinol methylase
MSYYTNHRAEMIPFLPNHYSRVLEIGCGEGLFRNHLHSVGEYWGIELSAQAATSAACRLSRVLVGTFEARKDELPDGYFDLVICNDVMEHMPDHEEFLRSIRTKMAEGSCLVGSVPNVRYIYNLQELIFRKDWQYGSEGILDRTHLRFFTIKSLRRTFVDNYFHIECLQGINGHYQAQGTGQRLIDAVMTFFLGSDIRFLQFAFRLKASGLKP